MKKLLNILFVLFLVLPLYGQSSLDNPIVFTPYLYVPGWISTDSLYARAVVISSTLDLSGTISGDLDVAGKAVVEESLRVNLTSRLTGTVTAGATATPVVITSTGTMGIGLAVPATKLDQGQFSADALGSYHTFSKSRHATAGSHTVVQDNDVIGGINFAGSDGTDFGTVSAQIKAEVTDATPAASSIGGALVFSTATGATSDDLTERMRIGKDGLITGNYFSASGYVLTPTILQGGANILNIRKNTLNESIMYFDGKAGAGLSAVGIGTTTPASNSLTLGTKATQRDLIVTRENTPAGTDSSAKLWVDDGDGKLGLRAGDADSLILTCANDTARIKSNNPIQLSSQTVIEKNGIGATQDNSYGLLLENTTAAAAGAQQYSPPIRLRGYGWKTNATAASQSVDWIIYNVPVEGTSAPSSDLYVGYSINGAAYSLPFKFSTTNSLFQATGLYSTNLWIDNIKSKSTDINIYSERSGYNVNLDITDVSGVDGGIRLGDTGNAGEYSRVDSVGVFYSPSDAVKIADVITSNNAVVYKKVVSLADGAQHILPTGVEGWGSVMCNGEKATFYFTSAGAVSMVAASTAGLTTANISTTEDNDTTLNVFDDGSGIGIENELGGTYNVLIDITYYTP